MLGPFFYFLLIPPLLLGENIYSSSTLWHFAFLALTYTVLFSFLKKICTHKKAFFLWATCYIFASSVYLYNPLNFAWNASFCIIFHLLAVINLYFWRVSGNKKYLWLLFLTVFLGIQIHLLVATHLLTALFFLRFRYKILLVSALFFFLLKEPTYLTYLKTIFDKSAHDWSFWMVFVKKGLIPFYIIPLFPLLYLVVSKRLSSNTKILVSICLLPLLVSLFYAKHHWYLYPVPFLMALIFTKCGDGLIGENKKRGGLFLATLLVTCYFVKDLGHVNSPYLDYNLRTYQRWESYRPMLEQIIEEQNYSPNEAIKKVYLLGFHPDLSFLAYYSLAQEKMAPSFRRPQKGKGYIIVQETAKERDWKHYITSSSNFPPAVKREIEEGKIVLGISRYYRGNWLIPYQARKESLFQDGFHNITHTYLDRTPAWLKECEESKTVQQGRELYFCLVQAEHELQKAGVHLKVQKGVVQVGFYGPLIGASATIFNSLGIAKWSNISLGVVCDNKQGKYLFPEIGQTVDWYSKERDFVRQQVGNMLISPLEVTVQTRCRNRPQEVTLYFKHTHRKLNSKTEQKIKLRWN